MNVTEETLSRGFCIGCGICEAVCPSGAIKIEYTKYKEYAPKLDNDKCTDCGLCSEYCPNTYTKRKKLIQTLSEQDDKVAYGINNAVGYYVCSDCNMNNLLRSASGGFTTAFAKYLYSVGAIDCVIHGERVTARKGEEHYKASVSFSESEIDSKRSSIYGQLNFSDVLGAFKGKSYKILVIGTPCVISGMKRLFSDNRLFNGNKIYTVSLCCSHSVNGQFIDFLGEYYNVPNEEYYTVDLRAKSETMTDHNEYIIRYENDEKFLVNAKKTEFFNPLWRNYCFANEACCTCADFWGAEADISTKDAWGSLGDGCRYGKSIVIFRNKELMTLFNGMRGLNISPVSFDDVRNCQVPTVRFKQEEILDRFDKNIDELSGNDDYKRYMNNIKMSKRAYAENGYKHMAETIFSDLMNDDNGKKSIKQRIKRGAKGIVRVTKLNKLRPVYKPFLRDMRDLFRYKKRKYNKILMMGTFNKINAGDEAQIDSTIKIMQDRYPDHLVKVLTHIPLYTHKNHYNCVVGQNPREAIWDHDIDMSLYYNMDDVVIRSLFLLKGYWMCFNAYLVRADLPTLFLNAKKAALLQDIKTSDLLYFSGGGAMSGATLSRCWDFMFCMKMAKILKVPCVMSGQNSGIWNSKFTERLVRKTLRYADAVTLREPYAVDNLAKIGIKGDHVFTMFDDALFCDKIDDVSDIISGFGIDPDDEFISLNMHYWGAEDDTVAQKLILERIGKICDHMTEKTGLKILLVPNAAVDAEPIQDLYNSCENERLRIARFKEYDFRVLRGIFARSKYCVTMKHHPIIFAVGETVPTISLAYKPYYEYKNKGALKIFGLEKFSVDLEKDSYFEDFKMLFDEMIENRTEISNSISCKLNELKERREKFLNIIDRILK